MKTNTKSMLTALTLTLTISLAASPALAGSCGSGAKATHATATTATPGIYDLAGAKRRERKGWALEMAGLVGKERTLTANLSGGWKQRLALGACTLPNPQLLLLDEPTAGVDPKARREFWEEIHRLAAEGITVLVSTHYMDEAERCHRVALMHAGKLLALDTIPRLKKVFASGSVLDIECRDAARALEHLEDLPGVLDAALFGSHLHAVIAHPEVEQTIASHLEDGGFAPVTVQQVEPSLEDVFIRSIRDAEEGRQQ